MHATTLDVFELSQQQIVRQFTLTRYARRTTFRVPSALRTWISDCETWQNTSKIWIIFRFMSAAASPRLAITFRSADDSGSSKPSRMNSRQKSFFVEVGLCSSNTEPIPLRACTINSLCSAKSSSRRSTRTFNPRHLVYEREVIYKIARNEIGMMGRHTR